MAVHTDTLRRFNRTYTQRIGALDESFLGTGFPLGVSRLLFEIGPDGATVRDLRERLDLDSGYVTRLLRRLGDDGLVEVRPDPDDRRRRLVSLTKRGRTAWRDLDDRSEDLARSLVEPLTERQRDRLTEALATADLLVRAATVHLRAVDPSDPVAVEAVGHYFAELDRRFPSGFDPGEGAHDAEAMAPGAGVFLVATSDGHPVACGGVQRVTPGVGEVKRMWVDPDWRGAGLGSRMLRRLEAEAARLGHDRVVLDTNGTLLEAIAMYERAGYRHIERYNDNPYAQAWFEKELALDLRPSRASSGGVPGKAEEGGGTESRRLTTT
jgi:DNA-binding MarR family transcriptional regulator/N-acetylglutamate synthase-like GNAT family acetyltransferase